MAKPLDADSALHVLAARPDPPRRARLEAPTPKAPSTSASRVIYVALALLAFLLGSVVVLRHTGLLAREATEARVPWDLSVIFLAVLTTIAMGVLVGRRAPTLVSRIESPLGTDRRARGELLAIVAGLALGAVCSSAAIVTWLDAGRAWGPFHVGPMTPVTVAGLAVLLSFAPFGFYRYADERRVRALEERFPDLLRDLNESQRAGLTMAQAVRVAAKGDYGRLTPDVSRMAHQVSWGVPFHEALRMFSERVRTPLVDRTVALIIKSMRAGGNVADVLAAAARDAREMKLLERERILNMSLYVIVIYVAFAVFLTVTAALQRFLIPSLLTSTTSLDGDAFGGLTLPGRMTFEQFQYLFFSIGLVQALGSGMVAGVVAEGSVAAGLKHSAVLVAITLFVFGVLL